MSEAEFIIDVYRGFQSSIMCGETYLSFREGLWRIDWEAPRLGNRKRFAGRFEFDAGVGVMDMRNGEEIGRRWAVKFRDAAKDEIGPADWRQYMEPCLPKDDHDGDDNAREIG